MANNSNETSFLESQRARTENLVRHRSEKAERLHAFWSSLKKCLIDWNDRLQRLDTVSAPLTKESDKRRVHLELCQLADELKELRKTCLTSTDTTATTIYMDENSATATTSNGAQIMLSMIVPPPDDELPATDLRLLHRDFSHCQANLDACRNKLLPTGKFVFRRYRHAMLQRAVTTSAAAANETTHEIHDNSGLASSPAAADSAARMKEAVDSLRTTLQDLVNVKAVVHADGRVEVESTAAFNRNDNPPAGRQSVAQQLGGDGTGQLVLRNLRDCTVTL